MRGDPPRRAAAGQPLRVHLVVRQAEVVVRDPRLVPRLELGPVQLAATVAPARLGPAVSVHLVVAEGGLVGLRFWAIDVV